MDVDLAPAALASAAAPNVELSAIGSMIPVKCFTCGKEISAMFEYYKMQVVKYKKEHKQSLETDLVYLTRLNKEKTAEGVVLDKLNLGVCCRRHLLTHVELE